MAAAYGAPQQSVYPESYVGFDSITKQIEKKLVKRGFQFNIICVGKLRLHPAVGEGRPRRLVLTLLQARPVSESRP